MADPYATVADRVITIVEGEFTTLAPPDLTVENDKLGRSAGKDGAPRCAVWPEAEEERAGRVIQLTVRVRLQLYLAYVAEPDEGYVVNPRTITAIGDRLRRAFKDQSSGSTSDMWFLRLTAIDYPDDPTGNKSRLEASIEAACDNPAAL